MAKLTKEARQRNQRRRTRQMLGVVVSVLIVIGCVSVIRASADLVATIFDDTEEKADYSAKLAGLVLFDPLPFDGVANLQDSTLREAALWGTIYRILATETGFDNYDRKETTDQVILPSIEVDAYLATVFGPEFQMKHKTFEMEGMTFFFDETLQGYYIPVTSVVGAYTPEVEELHKEAGRLYVTVGYVPIDNTGTMLPNSGATAQVSKYMEYIFERTSGNWYLVGLQESDKQIPVVESQVASSSSVPTLEDFETVVQEDLVSSNS